MDSERLLGLGLAMLVASITPGPNNIILATAGSMFGLRQGLPLMAGVILGFTIMISASVWGFGELLSLYASYVWWIGYVGVGFLCWLSWKIATAPVGRAVVDRDGGLMILIRRGFWGMLGFQFINPKGITVALALTMSFIDYNGGDTFQQFLWMVAISFCCSVVSASVWLLLGRFIGDMLRDRGWERLFNVCMGFLLFVSTLPTLYEFLS